MIQLEKQRIITRDHIEFPLHQTLVSDLEKLDDIP